MYPEIPGLKEYYKGKQLHSHYYRDPENYKGTKNAIIFGGGPSGRDISLDLAPSCDNVYICHNKDSKIFSSNQPENVQEKANISHVNENGDFVLTNDDVIQNVDLLIICTGYLLDFPFLNPEIRLTTTGNRRALDKLYKFIVLVDFPSLYFVGIPYQILPFPLFHQQCGYVTSLLAESAELPSRIVMENDIQTA